MTVEYSAVLVRYGEIGLKSRQTRRRMIGLLIRHIKSSLREHQVEYSAIKEDYGRIYVMTTATADAASVLSNVFGVVSCSPIVVTTSDLETILQDAVQVARHEFRAGSSFAVRAHRVGTHNYRSQDIRERLGERILRELADYSLRVDLDCPDNVIAVEVRNQFAYIFTQYIKGIGGMPTGTQGRVVCTISTGLDSPVAAFKAMRRGCVPIFIYFDNSPYCDPRCTEIAIEQARTVARFIYNYPVKMYIVPHGMDLANAQQNGAGKAICIICKRNMLRLARIIALKEQADAIVTGEIIGEQASQTTANLRVISSVVTDLPILRPLAGDDKTTVEEMSRAIGTYRFAQESLICCQLPPRYPLLNARLENILEIEKKMDLDILENEVSRARVVILR